MTTQEILASLSSLEQELKNIKAARILAEDTITSYKEVKSEIQKFFSEFERDNSIITQLLMPLTQVKHRYLLN